MNTLDRSRHISLSEHGTPLQCLPWVLLLIAVLPKLYIRALAENTNTHKAHCGQRTKMLVAGGDLQWLVVILDAT